MAKPDSGIKLKAKNVFHSALDSLIRLITKGFVKGNKATSSKTHCGNTQQRNTYTNQREGEGVMLLFVLKSSGLKPVACLKYLLKWEGYSKPRE